MTNDKQDRYTPTPFTFEDAGYMSAVYDKDNRLHEVILTSGRRAGANYQMEYVVHDETQEVAYFEYAANAFSHATNLIHAVNGATAHIPHDDQHIPFTARYVASQWNVERLLPHTTDQYMCVAVEHDGKVAIAVHAALRAEYPAEQYRIVRYDEYSNTEHDPSNLDSYFTVKVMKN